MNSAQNTVSSTMNEIVCSGWKITQWMENCAVDGKSHSGWKITQWMENRAVDEKLRSG
jgi:hypothetical protein